MPTGILDETVSSQTDNEGHWSHKIEKVVLSCEENCPLNLKINGGSDCGEFAYVGEVTPPKSNYLMGCLKYGDVVLEIQGQKTAGYTQRDVVAWLNHCCRNGNPVMIKTIPGDLIVKDVRHYLSCRFTKGSVDHELQNTIRDNLYLRTVPCTTRLPREGEINGVDYCFLTPEEFMILERSGKLLESGIYEGNHYGTPKPPEENPVFVGAFSNGHTNDYAYLPGAHPSSEGKRRRNRSNVEAMTANNTETKTDVDHSSINSSSINQLSGNHFDNPVDKRVSPDNSDLGPLPSHWEKAYTDKGEPYFIDHSTGTSHWLDPRLARVRKKAIEECNEDELPYGWEKIDDPHYGTYYIDHVNRKTQYENPVLQARSASQHTNNLDTSTSTMRKSNGDSNVSLHYKSSTNENDFETKQEASSQSGLSLYLPCLPCVNDAHEKGSNTPPTQIAAKSPLASDTPSSAKLNDVKSSLNDLKTTGVNQSTEAVPFFTRNPDELQGQFIRTMLVKSNRGFGFTIVGGDDGTEEFLQIKSVVPHGPAWQDGRLKTGDVLVYVNDICVLGYMHQDIVTLFQSFIPGETVELEVCRGYPLQFDLNDPNNEIVTTVAVSSIDGHDNANGERVNDSRNNPSESVNEITTSLPDLSIHSNLLSSSHQDQMTDNVGDADDSRLKNAPDILDFHPNVPPKPEYLTVHIVKGNNGFGFTIADSACGQKVKKILDHPRCQNLTEGDILIAINNHSVKDMPHSDVVQVLKDCPHNTEAAITVQRGANLVHNKIRGKTLKVQNNGSNIPSPEKTSVQSHSLSPTSFKNLDGPNSRHYFRSKTPTADLYSSRDMDVIIPIRSKTPVVDTRVRPKTPTFLPAQSPKQSSDLNANKADYPQFRGGGPTYEDFSRHALSDGNKYGISDIPNESGKHIFRDDVSGPTKNESNGHNPILNNSKYNHDEQPQRLPYNHELERAEPLYPTDYPDSNHAYVLPFDKHQQQYNTLEPWNKGPPLPYLSPDDNYREKLSSSSANSPYVQPEYQHLYPEPYYGINYGENEYYMMPVHPFSDFSMGCDSGIYGYQPTNSNGYFANQQTLPPMLRPPNIPGGGGDTWRKQSTSFEHAQPSPSSITHVLNEQKEMSNGSFVAPRKLLNYPSNNTEMFVTLGRQESGFGFRIVGGTEEGSQVSIGHIVPGGSADVDGTLQSGDEIVSVDGHSVLNTSHHHVVQLMGNAATNGRVTLGIRRKTLDQDGISRQSSSSIAYPYDVTVTRNEYEGFGFVIISSVTRAGSAIGRIIENSPAERCNRLHVGDRILAVNGTNIMNLHHGEIVNLIKESGYSVTLTIGPPQDDACSTTSNSQSHKGDEAVDEEQYFAVELNRGTRGFGFSIRGGKEFQNMPLYVLRIADVGPAVQDGRLKIGDEIIEINGINTKNMTHEKAIEIIKQGGSSVRLLVKRGSKLPAAVERATTSPNTTLSVKSPTSATGSPAIVINNSDSFK